MNDQEPQRESRGRETEGAEAGPEDSDAPSVCFKTVNENPAIADWFFCHRVQKFVDAFYLEAHTYTSNLSPITESQHSKKEHRFQQMKKAYNRLQSLAQARPTMRCTL